LFVSLDFISIILYFTFILLKLYTL